MKKNYIIILLFLFSLNSFCQIITVADKATLQPLSDVSIQLKNTQYVQITDFKGQADVSNLKSADSIYITKIGYKPLIIRYAELEKLNFKLFLSIKIYSLDELVVSASHFQEKRDDIPQQIQVISAQELKFLNQQSSADVMMQSGNVMVQKSQQGGGSPIIRGFEASKVLIVVDGVRMNNAIYRAGHLQNVVTIDNAIMDKIETSFGPGSVVYGSDALGGVMHFFTKNPLLSDTEKKNIKINAFTRYATANQEMTGHIDFNAGFKKIASLTSITYSDFSDLRQGNVRNPFYGEWGKRIFYVKRFGDRDSMMVNDNVNIQRQSGFQQADLMQKFLLKQNENVLHILNFQLSTSTDVPRYDRLTQLSGTKPKYAEWYYGPQQRFLAAYNLQMKADKGIYNKANAVIAFQNIEESRHDRGFNKHKRNNRIETVDVLSLNMDFEKEIKKQELRYGIEAVANQVYSKANSVDITNGVTSPLDTRFPDGGSNMNTAALYLSHTWEINKYLILSDGIRYSLISLTSKFEDTTFYHFPFKEITRNSSALNGSLGLVLKPGHDWRISLLGSNGFRAPNVDDMTKIFESVPGNVIVPNPGLRPEYTYNMDLGISKTFDKKITASVTGFYTWYIDAITSAPGKFNGQDSALYNGVVSKVTMQVNAQQAYLYGTNCQIAADITENFSLTSSLNYTFGRIKTDSSDYPLDHIPPVFGKTGLNFTLKKFRSEFYVMYSDWKRLADYNMLGEDNFPNATKYGMPGWYTLNIRGSYQINKYIQANLSMENILDKNYTVFASNICAPGRNVMMSLRFTL